MKRCSTIAVLAILCLAVVVGGCTGDGDVQAESTTTTVLMDLAPPQDCQGAIDEAVGVVAQLVEYVDSQSLDELQAIGTDEFLEEMSASIEQLHEQYGDTCAQPEYEGVFRQAVDEIEANTGVSEALLDLFMTECPFG